MSEVVEVEAVPIDVGIATSTLIDKAVAAAATVVQRWGEDYSPRVPETLEDYRQVKRERAALRRDIASITDTRKTLFAEVKSAIREGELRFSGFVDEGKALDAEYKRGIDEYERGIVSRNMDELLDYYKELAPDLVPLVALDKIADKWGKADKWASATANQERMRAQLVAHVNEIASNETAIDGLGLPADDARRLKEIYFDSLDLAAAERQLQAEREQRERVRALEDERNDRMQAATNAFAGAAGATEKPEGPKAAPEDAYQPDGPQTAPQRPTAPNPIATSIADRAGVAPGEAVPPIAFMAYVTETQRAGLVAYCKQHDIHGSFRPTNGKRMTLVPKDGMQAPFAQ